MVKILQINTKDNVAVCITPLTKGEEVQIGGTLIRAAENIPQGHKIAIRPIEANENVIKYGFAIGHATECIAPGSWVHIHNMRTNLSGEVTYTYHPALPDKKIIPSESFLGYQRPDGRVGVRNEIWIIPTVGCVNDIAKHLAEQNQNLVTGTVEGIYAFTHPFGCSQTGKDHAATRKILADLVRHPNAGGVLVLSLGCENLTHDQFLQELGSYDPDRVKFLTCQDVDDEFSEGSQLLKELAEYAGKFHRTEVSMDHLVVGLKCGGSDGLSGITANPTVGRFSDILVAEGGTTILTEVPEMFGAEEFLLHRCKNEAVFEKASAMLNGFKDYFISHHEVVYDNPSPGNKQGGITTLEDKSCGCVQKGGTSQIVGVLGYGDKVCEKGLNLLYGPGNDLVSTTNLTAAGALLILFTTGRGTPFGAPVPTLKISTNDQLYQHKKNWIDFNAGSVVSEGESLEKAGRRLFDLVRDVASGQKTKSEINGFREISIFKDGVVL
jgi:altronate hydrolase